MHILCPFFLHTHLTSTHTLHTYVCSYIQSSLSVSLKSKMDEKGSCPIISPSASGTDNSLHLITIVKAAGLWSQLCIKCDKSVFCSKHSSSRFYQTYISKISSHRFLIHMQSCGKSQLLGPSESLIQPLIRGSRCTKAFCDNSNRSVTQFCCQQIRTIQELSPTSFSLVFRYRFIMLSMTL